MANTYLTSSYGSTTNRRTWTYSFWIKRAGIGAEQHIWSARNASSTPYIDFRFEDSDIINFYEYSGSGYSLWFKSDRRFRDTFGWYHIVIACDTTQATAANRMKIYINGVQETEFSAQETYPSQNFDTAVNANGYLRTIGSLASGTANFNGSLSHFYFIDGLAYAPTVFGETDSDSGEWKIITSPTVTYGTNGFLIMKDGKTITDQSSNSNDFTLGGGTLTKTEDCPDNVFATFNAAYKSGETLSYGNTKTNLPSSDKFGGCATIGVPRQKGKFYAEFKCANASGNESSLGIYGHVLEACQDNQGVGKEAFSHSYVSDGRKYYENTPTSYGDSYDDGDIISMALDATNDCMYFAKNGTWQNSGVPTSGASKTGGISVVWQDAPDGFWTIAANSAAGGSSAAWKANFGNGYFADTIVATAGTNASNIGIFEYDVPAGFTALSTKGLQE